MSKLTLIVGPMRAGKTSRLLAMHARGLSDGYRCLLVGSALDTHSPAGAVRSHPGASSKAEVVDRLATLRVAGYDQVYVNECQFFQDPETIASWLDQNPGLLVVACGLDSDYKRAPFGPWLGRLIPHATDIVKLLGICSTCGEATALFTHKIRGRPDRLDVTADYKALCRGCYIRENL